MWLKIVLKINLPCKSTMWNNRILDIIYILTAQIVNFIEYNNI